MLTPDDLLTLLIEAGALDGSAAWVATPLGGGFNTSVFRVRSAADPEGYIARVRERGSFASEAAALTEVAACPGVPALIYAAERVLLHRYLPGRPQPLAEVANERLPALMASLICIHGPTYPDYTPWPEHERVPGSLADLFRFRVRSLANYAAYPRAVAGELDPRLPALLARLDEPALLAGGSWAAASFARLHGDLSIGNILWNADGVGLIDWEFSRVGDPAEELAYLLTEQSAGSELVEAVRIAYARAGGDERAWERVSAYGLFTAVDSALWWTDYIARHDPPQGRRALDARLEMAARWLPSEAGN